MMRWFARVFQRHRTGHAVGPRHHTASWRAVGGRLHGSQVRRRMPITVRDKQQLAELGLRAGVDKPPAYQRQMVVFNFT